MLFVKCKSELNRDMLISMREVAKIHRAYDCYENDRIETRKGEKYAVVSDDGIFENAVVNLEWEEE